MFRLLSLALVVLVDSCLPAHAQGMDVYQQWIHDNHSECCNHKDCGPANVKFVNGVWRVDGADNEIKPTEVISWPFSIPYACIYDRHARCLFLRTDM